MKKYIYGLGVLVMVFGCHTTYEKTNLAAAEALGQGIKPNMELDSTSKIESVIAPELSKIPNWNGSFGLVGSGIDTAGKKIKTIADFDPVTFKLSKDSLAVLRLTKDFSDNRKDVLLLDSKNGPTAKNPTIKEMVYYFINDSTIQDKTGNFFERIKTTK